MTIRFLHTSDLQIGMTRHFLSAESLARYCAARIDAIRNIGEVAKEHKCDFIVVAGDIFEHNALDTKTINRTLEELKALPVPAFLLPGNHDPLEPHSPLYKATQLDNITAIEDSTPYGFRTPSGEYVEIVGAPLKTKHHSSDLVAEALGPLTPADHVRVVLGHGPVLSFANEIVPDLIDLAYAESKIRDRSVDYVALGDTHSAQSLGSTGQIWYSGSPEPTDYLEKNTGGGENNSGNVLVVEVDKQESKVAVNVLEVSVGTWCFEALDFEVHSFEDAEHVLSTLQAYPHKSRTVIKYALSGTVDVRTQQYVERGLAELEETFAALYKRQRLMDFHLRPTEEELMELASGGYVAAATHELLEAAQDLEPTSERGVVDPLEEFTKAEIAQESLHLLFRLSKGQG